MRRLLTQPFLGTIGSIFCSTEQKAIGGAEVLAEHLSLPYETVAELGENDRSSTGYLSPSAFWDAVDSFFSHPDMSAQGWERRHVTPSGASCRQ